MSKPLYILVDLQEEYLIPIQIKLFQELGNSIDIEIISEKEYFDEYFSTARSADVLLICEELFNENIQRQDIANIFVVSENINLNLPAANNIFLIYKYTSVKEIYDEIAYKIVNNESKFNNNKDTQIIVVYSPIGGIGKTTIALGLAAALEENYKKILYVDAEYIQSLQCYIKEKSCLPGEFNRYLYQKEFGLYNQLKPCIRRENFAYLPPLKAPFSSLNVDLSAIMLFLEEARKSKDYDYIIVDTDSSFNSEKSQLIDVADKVLIITGTDHKSRFLLDVFADNVNIGDKEKFVFVCNFFTERQKSELDQENSLQYMIGAYIARHTETDLYTIENIAELRDIRKLAYMI